MKIFKYIIKRGGQVVPFNPKKISNAIYKATEAVGKPNFKLAENLANETIRELAKKIPKGKKPNVEETQDAVEKVLIKSGNSRIAKAYILYRQKRAKIRSEKQQILDKKDIDDIDKQFDINALRVLRSRYLKKDESGKILESPKELFTRVAIHSALPSVLYDEKIFLKKPNKQNAQNYKFIDFDFQKYDRQFKIGSYALNQFHIEALKKTFDRMAQQGYLKVSFNELLYLIKNGGFNKYEKEIESYYSLMSKRRFMPNTPALANFGTYLGMGSACFVLDIKDSIDNIMQTLKEAAIIFKSGGGVGYNFSKLRPENDFVKSTGGIASGPISFMTLFDRMTEVIKQGGIRRGANMGILNISHPNIEKFITAKKGNLALKNFNISVLISKDFMEHLERDAPFPLVNPKSKNIAKRVNSRAIFDLIAYQAWESAEPGVIFEDHLNKHNPFLKSLGPLQSTNPCGELPLYPYESCNLGSINIYSFIKSQPTNGRKKEVEFDWKSFRETIYFAVQFLDNVIDINKYPMQEIEDTTLKTRKIGLGIMGLADVLLEMDLPYNSEEGLVFMEQIMESLNYHSKIKSAELAFKRGSFPYFKESFYPDGKLPFPAADNAAKKSSAWKKLIKKIKANGIRNSHTTVIAPTGSISMIAGCSSGMEPIYSLIFEKEVPVGSFYYVNPIFEQAMMREGLFDEQLIKDVSQKQGSVKNISYIPAKFKKIFVTALDIKSEDHIKALAACQKWTDLSISKTINFPSSATVDDIKKSYLLAYKLGCKDISVFRDKSIETQVLYAGAPKKKEIKSQKPEELISLKDVKAKGLSIYHEAGASEKTPTIVLPPAKIDNNIIQCPFCQIELKEQEGCKTCLSCGWGMCS